MTNNIKRHVYTFGHFGYVEKASDSMKHYIFEEALLLYGIREFRRDLMMNYLACRSRYFDIRGIKSNAAVIKYGVSEIFIFCAILFLC